MKKQNNIFVIGVFFVFVFIWLVLLTHDVSKEKDSNYDYCVEWDGWIHRENMFFNCYDFENLKIKCHYNILDNGDLKVVTYVPDKIGNDKIEIYPCSRYVKSKYVGDK